MSVGGLKKKRGRGEEKEIRKKLNVYVFDFSRKTFKIIRCRNF